MQPTNNSDSLRPYVLASPGSLAEAERESSKTAPSQAVRGVGSADPTYFASGQGRPPHSAHHPRLSAVYPWMIPA